MKKEYDNNPETNNSHVEHAVRLINKVINDYENGTLNKDTIWELGQHTWYHFMLNRIPRRDIDIFCDKFEGEVFFVQTSFYQKSENFLINAKIYKRLCDIVISLYQNVYLLNKQQDMILLYKFIAEELFNIVKDNTSEEYKQPLLFGYVRDMLKVIRAISKEYTDNNISKAVLEKSNKLLSDFDRIFITEKSTAVATHYDYTVIFDDDNQFLNNIEVLSLRKDITELANLIIIYGTELFK